MRYNKNEFLTVLFIMITLVGIPATGLAQLSTLLRRAGRLADDVPLRAATEPADNPYVTKLARESVEKGRHLDDLAYTKQLVRHLETTLGGPLDPHMLKSVEVMGTPALENAVVLCRGAQRVSEAVPDIARRGVFLSKANGDTLSIIGRYDGLADEAILFERAIDLKVLPSPTGVRALVFDDFGAFFRKTGDAGYAFWTKSVKPHWKLWAGSAALAAILLTPEEYLDEFGNLTHDGLKKVGSFGGTLLASTLQGTVEGSAAVVEKAGKSLCVGFFTSVGGVFLFLTIMAILLVRFRKQLISLCRRWQQWRHKSAPSA